MARFHLWNFVLPYFSRLLFLVVCLCFFPHFVFLFSSILCFLWGPLSYNFMKLTIVGPYFLLTIVVKVLLAFVWLPPFLFKTKHNHISLSVKTYPQDCSYYFPRLKVVISPPLISGPLFSTPLYSLSTLIHPSLSHILFPSIRQTSTLFPQSSDQISWFSTNHSSSSSLAPRQTPPLSILLTPFNSV